MEPKHVLCQIDPDYSNSHLRTLPRSLVDGRRSIFREPRAPAPKIKIGPDPHAAEPFPTRKQYIRQLRNFGFLFVLSDRIPQSYASRNHIVSHVSRRYTYGEFRRPNKRAIPTPTAPANADTTYGHDSSLTPVRSLSRAKPWCLY